MRRISANHAMPGMVLLRTIFDSRGNMLFKTGTKLSQESLQTLNIYGIGEIIIEDERVSDVPVQQLIRPEIEAEALQALRQLLTEHQGTQSVDPFLIDQLENVATEMARELFPEVIGEVNTSGCLSWDDYPYVQPIKVAGLALQMGKRAGYGMLELHPLAMSSLLKDVGYTAHASKADESSTEDRMHPLHGAEIISGYKRFGLEVAETVFQHHEAWDGSGYPERLVGTQISTFARILSIADTFYSLLSRRPSQDPMMPHEAVEYIMAYSGELFDPDLVQVFAKDVPLYPAGVMIKLNTGESGVVTRNNPGNLGRPIVRMFFNKRGRPRRNPYDMNLTDPEYQDRLVVEVMDY